jgi:hypothetical protein
LGEVPMPHKKRGSDSQEQSPPVRGGAGSGRLIHPAKGKALQSIPNQPQSAPMHGTPLPEGELERLKELAKSSPLPTGIASQEDPSTKN